MALLRAKTGLFSMLRFPDSRNWQLANHYDAAGPKPARSGARLGQPPQSGSRPLVSVSALTIYNWEHGRSRPRSAQLEAWGAIRNLGKREAWRRFEHLWG